MKILLAPSETKTNFCDHGILNQQSFIFEDLFDVRKKVIESFRDSCDLEVFAKNTAKAMNRYDGVAFDAIGYSSLNEISQKYIDANVVIFSNIFGPILAGDLVPPYSFKQGSKLDGIAIEKYYKEHFSSKLDQFIGEFVVDLRAGFYDKFYTPSMDVVTYKFIKDKKVVSHWAKFYRGLVVKKMALNQISSKDELLKMQIDNLQVAQIVVSKNVTTIVCEICN